MRRPTIAGLRRALRAITWQNVLAVLLAVVAVGLLGGLLLAKDTSEDRVAIQQDTNQNVSTSLEALKTQLDQSETTRRNLAADRERWQAQITTSINQLKDAGQEPIIVAPDAIPSPLIDKPVTTTTTPPIVVNPPVVVAPPVTDPPPTTTTEPPPTTTTTEPPPETTTTTTTEAP